ncbi:MAG: MFS transporter [Rickettsiaceae bacterium]|nr:MFS transporter [Rickettsiaceae bacterium]
MITKKKYAIICFLGFISGFTLLFSGNSLNYWLSRENIDIRTIGLFSVITLPYAINFIWAPVFDLKTVPIIGKYFNKRLAWIISLQIMLTITLYAISKINPINNIYYFACLGIIISFFASATDSVLGALRIEMVDRDLQGAVSGVYSLGYRLGMVISGYGGISLSSDIGWNKVYQLYSIITIIFSILLIFITKNLKSTLIINNSNNELLIKTRSRRNLISRIKSLVMNILKPIGGVLLILLIIAFLILYRLPDHCIYVMINPFLIHHGYSDHEIATGGKLLGSIMAIVGGLLAGHIMKKRDIFQGLLIFAILHAAAHTLFIVQDIYGKNLYLLYVVIGFESITGGMSMAAYIAYIAYLCQGRFRATQYSFFSSIMGLSRSVLPAISGYIVAHAGWKSFFFITIIATIPSLLLLLFLKQHNKKRSSNLSD